MSDLGITDNPFARLLVLYYHNKASKLQSSDLDKVAKKYALKGAKMLVDVQNKYEISVDAFVKLGEVARIVELYDIGNSFKALLPPLPESFKYDARLDPRSSSFSAEYALSNRTGGTAADCTRPLITSILKAPTLDFLAQAERFLTAPSTHHNFKPNYKGGNSTCTAFEREAVVVAAAADDDDDSAASAPLSSQVKTVYDLGVLGMIALTEAQLPLLGQDRAPDRKNRNMYAPASDKGSYYGPSRGSGSSNGGSGRTGLEDDLFQGTFLMLLNAMTTYKTKKGEASPRVEALIRDNYGVRGTVSGSLTGFDRHLNLLLTRATENYRLPLCVGKKRKHHLVAKEEKVVEEEDIDEIEEGGGDDEEEDDEKDEKEEGGSKGKETYSKNNKGEEASRYVGSCGYGRERARGPQITRSLPQLLVRGDSVVWVRIVNK